ncbi:hypothetical protein O7626_06690 [Micromonospora sp. WMMD1102]|uniref:hypothetical protein n=1 Tax=Micromonospora sp. WMMD1102 TaxID=3016105 RepID=UPI00241550F6|nr:hypothetical protein [Micromonospora sp. WMMD1102]MDG4785622.1 hypothetical protein [Micromonospora sp. WMMD1102]
MSVSLILIPLAVAAVAAAHGSQSARDEAGQVVCRVQTRMRDEKLLADALRETGAAVTAGPQEITAAWDGIRAGFARGEDGVWSAHFTGQVDESRAVEIVRAVDAGYGRQVQRAVLDRLRDRAPAAGLVLESETATEDAGVRLVFAVGREGHCAG